jgi:hypothetical protein
MTSPSSGIRIGRLPSAPSLVGRARALFHGLVPSGDHQLSQVAFGLFLGAMPVAGGALGLWLR